MKIVISYPPLDSAKGYPTLGQNRQFQYFNNPTYIYPMVPAWAATLLKTAGYEVVWNDCIAQRWDNDRFADFIKEQNPDLIFFETKTPVVKQHWQIINKLKLENSKLKIVLAGDHVTALPQESFENSKVDFVLTGGDYDFLLLNLCKELQTPTLRLHSGLALSEAEVPNSELRTDNLEAGIFYREDGQIKNTGQFKLNHNLNNLILIDRDLTNWKLYAYKNGNYKRTPGTYIMSGRDCWYHNCSFCSWPTLYPEFRTRAVDNVLDEIGSLIQRYRVKEIMDDTGTFPVGDWLREFCNGMIKRGFHKKIYLDCNMRFGALTDEDYKLMKNAGFRLLLFGLESGNQATLDRINKRLKLEEIVESCRRARLAGLYPHITIMFGYPWESYKEALNTLKLGRYLLKKGLAYTVQATVVIPYPGSLLFNECKQNDLLKTLDWSRYDMKEPIMKTPIEDKKIMALVQGIYNVAFHPEFLYHKITSIQDFTDIKYFLRAGIKTIGHLFDFKYGVNN